MTSNNTIFRYQKALKDAPKVYAIYNFYEGEESMVALYQLESDADNRVAELSGMRNRYGKYYTRSTAIHTPEIVAIWNNGNGNAPNE